MAVYIYIYIENSFDVFFINVNATLLSWFLHLYNYFMDYLLPYESVAKNLKK